MGYLWLHQLQLEMWRHAQWEELEGRMEAEGEFKGAITLTIADLDALEWENEHEFRYHGEMHDVLGKRKLSDGKWELRCIADDEESEMKAGFEAMVGGNESEAGRLPAGINVRMSLQSYLDLETIDLPSLQVVVVDLPVGDWQIGVAPSIAPDEQPPAAA